MSKSESFFLPEKEKLFFMIRVLSTLLFLLIILAIAPLDFRTYYSWSVFLVPLGMYMSLIKLGRYGERYNSANTSLFLHIELLICYLLTVILITLTGGVSSNFIILLVLPVLLYSLAFGSLWGYLASFANLFLLASFYHRAERPVLELEFLLVLSALFFVAGWSAGRAFTLKNAFKRRFSSTVLKNELTGLFNSRFFHYKVKDIMEKADKDLRIGLVLIQLDQFDGFKESWGSCAASILVKTISKFLLDNTNKSDFVVHQGDGKFAVMTRAGDYFQIIGRAEKLRKKLVASLEGGMEDDWKLPVAVGVAVFPDHAARYSSLQERAEDALQRAVDTRGSRVQVYYSILDRISTERDRKLISNVRAIMASLKARDRFLYGHSERVFIYAQLICRKLGLPARQVKSIEIAALVHDIGKVEGKRGAQEEKEPLPQSGQDSYEQHPQGGTEMLREVKQMQEVTPSLMHFHASFDGSGSPAGLKGTAIPLGARIMAVADFFDNITAESPLGMGKTIKEGIYALQQYRNSRFDPVIVDAFASALGDYEDISHLCEWPKDLSKVVPSGYGPYNYILGGHYAAYYSGEIHFSIKAMNCIAAGIANNEKCLYLTDAQKEGYLLQYLQVDNNRALEKRNSATEVYLERVSFPQYLLEMEKKKAKLELETRKMIKPWLDNAEREHFDSVRLIVDHSFLNLTVERLYTWERVLTRCIKNLDVVVVCFFDIKSIANQVDLIEALHNSPLIATRDEVEEEQNAR